MLNYKRILFATDLTDEIHNVDSKVKELAKLHSAELHVVHVVENLAAVAYQYMGTVELQDQLQEEATKEMGNICSEMGIPEQQRHIRTGHPKTEIIDLAEEINADLIVVGSHGRTGLSAFLGSTCNAVIHSARCDVLILRAKQDKKD
ncbi:MAG: universal stress protein [Pseudomonadota bacterium]